VSRLGGKGGPWPTIRAQVAAWQHLHGVEPVSRVLRNRKPARRGCSESGDTHSPTTLKVGRGSPYTQKAAVGSESARKEAR